MVCIIVIVSLFIGCVTINIGTPIPSQTVTPSLTPTPTPFLYTDPLVGTWVTSENTLRYIFYGNHTFTEITYASYSGTDPIGPPDYMCGFWDNTGDNKYTLRITTMNGQSYNPIKNNLELIIDSGKLYIDNSTAWYKVSDHPNPVATVTFIN